MVLLYPHVLEVADAQSGQARAGDEDQLSAGDEVLRETRLRDRHITLTQSNRLSTLLQLYTYYILIICYKI